MKNCESNSNQKDACPLCAKPGLTKTWSFVLAVVLFALSFMLAGGATTAALANDVTVAAQLNYSRGVNEGGVSWSEESRKHAISNLISFDMETGEKLQSELVANGVASAVVYSSSPSYLIDSTSATIEEFPLCTFCSVSGFIKTDAESLKACDLSLLTGRLPSSKMEIAVTLYEYELTKRLGYLGSENPEQGETDLPQVTDLLGKKFNYYANETWTEATIVGVIDTGFDFDYYEDYLQYRAGDKEISDEVRSFYSQEFNYEMQLSFHNALYVSQDFSETAPFVSVSGVAFKTDGTRKAMRIVAKTAGKYSDQLPGVLTIKTRASVSASKVGYNSYQKTNVIGFGYVNAALFLIAGVLVWSLGKRKDLFGAKKLALTAAIVCGAAFVLSIGLVFVYCAVANVYMIDVGSISGDVFYVTGAEFGVTAAVAALAFGLCVLVSWLNERRIAKKLLVVETVTPQPESF